MLILIIGFIIGIFMGFVVAGILISGKISDLEDENLRLRQVLYSEKLKIDLPGGIT